MNAKTIVLFVLFLAFGFIAKAEEKEEVKEIPGGVVFSDGKDVIYYDFGKKNKTNITADLNGVIADNPFTISEDGKTLFWFKNSNLWIRPLPNANPYTLKKTALELNKRRNRETIDVVIPQSAKNIVVSKNGNNISYEFEKPGISMVPIEPGSKIDALWFSKYQPRRVPQYWPLYIAKKDACNAIVFFKKDFEGNQPSTLQSWKYCGNTNFYAPIWPFRTNPLYFEGGGEYSHIPKNPLVSDGHYCAIGANISLPPQECIKRFSVRRDGHFATWSINENPDEELFAVIYQTPFGWGPIEIKEENKNTDSAQIKKNFKNMRPGIYEIPVLLKSCEGLAWKPEPDGGLTFLSEGKVFLLEDKQIRNGINKSGLLKAPITDMYPYPIFFPRNNVFPIQSQIITAGIKGSKHHWVNEAFIFRNENGCLELWDKGRLSKLMDFVPEEFYYCARPIFVANNPLVSNVVSGKDKSLKKEYGYTSITVGSIQTILHGGIDSVTFSLDKWELRKMGQKPLKFTEPEETDLNKITDPSKYQYEEKGQEVHGPTRQIIEHLVLVPLNKVVILNLGNAYAAIKPVKIQGNLSIETEKNPKVLAKLRKDAEKQWKVAIDVTAQNIVGDVKSITYEWKYWPNVASPVEPVKTAP